MADIQTRAVAALQRCHDETGQVPTATRYRRWRDCLPSKDRLEVLSATAIVPMAFETWPQARDAARLPGLTSSGQQRGPTRMWDVEECLAHVREYLAESKSGTLAGYEVWCIQNRYRGRVVPSASTVRLRISAPWSQIVSDARGTS